MRLSGAALDDLGWRPWFDDQLTGEEVEGCLPVRVMAVHRGAIAVMGSAVQQSIDPRMPGAQPTDDHPTVGDWLLVDRATMAAVRVLVRQNLFSRRSPGDPRKQQMIAANVDTLFIVASCNQDFNVARLERYLVLAREVGVTPIVVLTKIDLADDADGLAAAARAIQPGLSVHMIDGRDPASAGRLADYCGRGQTVALLGSSGVGKSTLVNTLRRSDTILTRPIRARDGTGQHTTTVREMHRLDRGGWLLDTPGMRELQLAETAAGMADVFDDFVATARQCRFSDCGHGSEPDCAVKAAIAAGTLTAERFDRWTGLSAEARPTTARSRRTR